MIIGVHPNGTITALAVDGDSLDEVLGSLLGGAPTPGQALSLVESTRDHVLGALQAVVCDLPADDTITHAAVTEWPQVHDVAMDGGLDLVDALSWSACRHAPMGAAVVTAWRGLARAALAHRDNQAAWRVVAERAEATTQLARWIYSGGYAHAIGGL